MSDQDAFQASLSKVKAALRTLFQAGRRDPTSLLADASMLLEQTLSEARRVDATAAVGPLVEALQILQEAQKAEQRRSRTYQAAR